jgi:hypothetical protein
VAQVLVLVLVLPLVLLLVLVRGLAGARGNPSKPAPCCRRRQSQHEEKK